MLRTITLGGLSVAAWILGPVSQQTAFACNQTQGCMMDVLHQNHDMMVDGRMTEAMRAGQENMQAFRRQQEADRAASARRSVTGR